MSLWNKICFNQTVETLIRCRVLRSQIWAALFASNPFPVFNGLKNETYVYGSWYSLKKKKKKKQQKKKQQKTLVSVSYSNLVWNLALINLAKQKLHIK